MACESGPLPPLIWCGDSSFAWPKTAEHTDMARIRETVKSLFGPGLPTVYELTFYDRAAKRHRSLDQELLDSPRNPFRVDSQDLSSTLTFIDLYVVDATEEISNDAHRFDNYNMAHQGSV